jgi:hypothetical protein
MSSSEAQKSAVHAATEDSTSEPTNDTARGVATPEGNRGNSPDQARDRGDGRGAGGARDALAAQAAELKARPDTAMGVPGNFERGAATADVRPDTDEDANPPGPQVIGGGPGAGDSSSGGGAGAGVPGGGTDIRTDGALSGGDVDEDRRKLFPAAAGDSDPAGRARNDDAAVGKDPDQSSYGGPLNLDDPDAV